MGCPLCSSYYITVRIVRKQACSNLTSVQLGQLCPTETWQWRPHGLDMEPRESGANFTVKLAADAALPNQIATG